MILDQVLTNSYTHYDINNDTADKKHSLYHSLKTCQLNSIPIYAQCVNWSAALSLSRACSSISSLFLGFSHERTIEKSYSDACTLATFF
jgi:hypothetical protein